MHAARAVRAGVRSARGSGAARALRRYECGGMKARALTPVKAAGPETWTRERGVLTSGDS
jgi:hypothetical protein